MKQLIFFILIALIGCADTDENAAANLKKGNDFFEKKEYEVAEYYFERIPETSPLHKEAVKKLDVIAKIKRQWVEKEVSPADLSKIIILEHTFQVDNVARIPSHRLSLVNNTDRILQSIEVEFTYFDKSNKEIMKLVGEVRTPMFQNTQDVFKGIEPGYVQEEFATATAKIIKARFQ
ncbi:MAG: hypothetical protein HYV29_00330 [Ignavibacteriales bacterium]|nr:hypothetical protein [Ignavibacteriales bacterium]